MATDPFYTLYTDDGFMAAEWLASIQASMQGNVEIVKTDTKSQHVSEILDLLYSYSMFGSNRLIVVSQKKELDEKQQEKLFTYIDQPTQQTTVVWQLEKIDKRKKFYKDLIKKTQFVALETPKLAQMSAWVDRLSTKYGVSIDREAKGLLIDFIGTDVGRMNTEIGKLALYIHPAQKISKDDVFTMVMKLNGDDIFACTDAVMDKNAKKAFEGMYYLFESGVNAFAILSMFTRHVRILMKIQSAAQNRIPRSQLAAYVGVPPFALGKYQQQSKKFPMTKCNQTLKILSQLDTEMKSTGIGQERLLEKAIVTMVGL